MLRGIGIGVASAASAVGLGCALYSKYEADTGPAKSFFGASSSTPSTVASFSTSGLLFKDTVDVKSFEDPKVKGITLYISRVKRPMLDKLRKGFFQEPSCAAVSAVRTGPPSLVTEIDRSVNGENVFSEMKNVVTERVEVRRVYDAKKNTLLYIAYNNILTTSGDEEHATTMSARYQTSISCIPLYNHKLEKE